MFFLLKGVVEATVSKLSQLELEQVSLAARSRDSDSGPAVASDVAGVDTVEASSSPQAPEAPCSGHWQEGVMHRGPPLQYSRPRPQPGDRVMRSVSMAEALGSDLPQAMPVGLYSDGAHFGQVLVPSARTRNLVSQC